MVWNIFGLKEEKKGWYSASQSVRRALRSLERKGLAWVHYWPEGNYAGKSWHIIPEPDLSDILAQYPSARDLFSDIVEPADPASIVGTYARQGWTVPRPWPTQ